MEGEGGVKKIPSVGEVWIFSGTPQFVKIREYYLRLLHVLLDWVEYEILYLFYSRTFFLRREIHKKKN